MSDISAEEQQDADVPMETITVDGTADVTAEEEGPTDADADALLAAYAADLKSLAITSTRKAYGPFETEYKECLDAVFEGNPPNPDNAFRYMLFHAYRPARRSRRPALGGGRFCLFEWNTVVNNATYAAGLVAEQHKDQFVMSRGHLSKVRSAILNVAQELAPGMHKTLQDDVRLKKLLKESVMRKNRNNRMNYKEKGSSRIHALEADDLRAKVEGYMWDETADKGLRDMCSHLRNRATLNVTMTTLLRNDSWRVCELSDMAFYSWKDKGEETPFSLLNYEVSSKTTRDSDKPEIATSFRHKDPRLCPQGSTAFYLYLRFLLSDEPADWDFFDNSSWFDVKMNINIGDKQAGSISYNKVVSKCGYYDALKKAAKHFSIAFEHWEHFGRFYGSGSLEKARVQPQANAAHGGWEKKVRDNHYSTGIVVSALLGAAGFDAEIRGSHRNPRVSILPPKTLISRVWPWIDEWKQKLQEHPDGGDRVTAKRFLDAMTHMRIVLLQDAAWFIKRGRGNHGLFHIPGTIFVDPLFLEWAEQYHRELEFHEHPNNDPNFQFLERTNAGIAASLSSIRSMTESNSAKYENCQQLLAVTGNTVLSMCPKLWEMHSFQQYVACHSSSMQQFASSLPPFDPRRSYHWPSVEVSHTPIDAVSPSVVNAERNVQMDSPFESPSPANATQETDNDNNIPSAPKIFNHCPNGCMEILSDYLGREGSVFSGHGGIKVLRTQEKWYRNLHQSKKENETAKSYVRRLCTAGAMLESLIEKDMTNTQCNYEESVQRVCDLVDTNASQNSQNTRYISLKKITECLKRMNA